MSTHYYPPVNISKLSNVVSRVVSRELQESTYTYDYYGDTPQLFAPQPQIIEASPQQHDVMTTNSQSSQDHTEAYYLYFIAVLGIILNCVVVLAVFFRKPLRKMTSGFLIHACFLDLLKCTFCIPFASNLLTQHRPEDCDFLGSSYVILVTISVFNMVAMVCTEAYTFGEKNIGGNSKGTAICITFGIVLVYIGSIILHLGPTLIGGHFDFQPDIGSCSFTFGKQTGYVAHIMWVVITSVAMLAVYHFIHRLYKEIQFNRPNRVSFLVRTSITVMDSSTTSTWKLRKIIRDATHRAKLFILNTIIFVICWYPFFMLVIIDKSFKVAPKWYQTFAFIAWSQGAIQPVIYICFDRNLNILAKYMKCVKMSNDVDKFFELLAARHEAENDQTVPTFSEHETESFEATGIHNNLNPYHGPQSRQNDAAYSSVTRHRDICVLQNSSNQSSQNCAMNIPYGENTTDPDLTYQLNNSTTPISQPQTQHPQSQIQTVDSTDNVSRAFSVNSDNLPSTPSTDPICDIYQNYNNDAAPPQYDGDASPPQYDYDVREVEF